MKKKDLKIYSDNNNIKGFGNANKFNTSIAGQIIVGDSKEPQNL